MSAAHSPLDATVSASAGTQWEWERGDHPAFTPRQASVSAAALERLREAGQQVVLGWFHRYPARFAAEVVTGILGEVVVRISRSVNLILDPFCGTGSVVSAGRQVCVSTTGVELTPLGVTIGRLRIDPPRNPWDAAAFCERLARTPAASKPTLDDDLTAWLGDDNARLLTAWLPALNEIDDPRLHRFVTVAVSQSLRPSSRWLSASVKVTADPRRTPIPLNYSLPRWARQLARDCVAEQEAFISVSSAFGAPVTCSKVEYGDAKSLPAQDATVDAIITSPPYFVTYDYFDVQRLTYLAFGWPAQRHEQIGAKYGHRVFEGEVVLPGTLDVWYREVFGGERTTLGRALRVYVEGLRAHLREALRVVAPGGIVAYSLANTVRSGMIFNLVSGFEQLLEEAGFQNVEAIPRKQAGRRILPAGRDIQTGRFSSNTSSAGVREYVIYGTRP